MEKYTMFMDQKNHYSENEDTTQSNLQIQCNPYQATNGIIHRGRTNNFTICKETQKTLRAKAILRKKNGTGGINLPDFRLYYKATVLENPMDRGAWWAAVHGFATSWTRLSNFPFNFHFHALQKEMATHSSVLAWTIPGTGEPDGLPSMGSHRVGHD